MLLASRKLVLGLLGLAAGVRRVALPCGRCCLFRLVVFDGGGFTGLQMKLTTLST